jgi:hypothetical protein
MGANCYIELDEYPHFVVLVRMVRQFRIKGILLHIYCWKVVRELLLQLLLDLVKYRICMGKSQPQIFHQLRRKQLYRHNSVMQVPSEGISQFELIPIDVYSYGYEFFNLIRLCLQLFALDPKSGRLLVSQPWFRVGIDQFGRSICLSIAVTTVALTVESTRGEPLSIFRAHLFVVVCLVPHVLVVLRPIGDIVQHRRRVHEVPVDIFIEEDLVEVLLGPLAVG